MGEGAIEGGAEHAISSRSSDLLLRFSGGFSTDELAETAGGGDSDEIELELSLGGCFSSVDCRKARISRSSSIPSITELPAREPVVPLSRASSLPSGTEEEMWRRKELQSVKRMEVKRKMEERRMVGQRFEQDLEEGSTPKLRRFDVENGGSWIVGGERAKGVSSPAVSKWIAGAPMASVSTIPLGSQGSIVSQASSSSGGTELESRPAGARQGFELSGFSSDNPLTMAEHKHHKSSSVSPSSSLTPTSNPINGTMNFESPLKKTGGRCDNGRNMEEMPSVSTRGDGPNGRRIEGFLYKYRRGEEVRIVCVCHGSFLTPAEFVKHGGGGDVTHPLKHIVVNPNPAFL